ncbi:hypothetical protein [Helicobacter pylori]|uniref:hypothetical protein n=1 Tax=Helicobacter pylori TaxID=210 RepID=UPI00292928F3|nr:hypothetical protein [Helicobacter pylori]MDU9777374.1 hypothetical protein [Helicobacter pylori]
MKKTIFRIFSFTISLEGVEVLMDTTSSLNKQGYKIISMVESPFDKGVLIVAYEKCLEFKKELNHE